VKIGNPGEARLRSDACVVEQDIEASEAVDGLRKCRLHLIRIADVGSHKRRARTLGFD
jgi:hypothetical protein